MHLPLVRPLAFISVLAALVAPTLAVAQPRCEAPQVLLSVDKSSSMLGALPAGGNKWEAARSAIGSVTGAYADRIDFGLQIFPYPNRCEPGAVTLDVGHNDSATILGALGTPPPDGGNYTPMAQTLDVISAYGRMRDATRDNHVILITDGWQWCSPYDPSTRFTPVDSITRLRAAGITVHVVGFGAAVDSLTLNRAAVAAGTSLPGCDPTLTDPMAMNHCYVQANDMVALRDALDAIARDITDEICDGFDNDCDGMVDEGFDADGDGFRTCDGDCNDADATAYPGAMELCDGLDNDCDGASDSACDCTPGDARPCGFETGMCETGTQTCGRSGAWGACDGEVGPTDEICNNEDEDCDGEVDEDADCGEFGTCVDGGCVDLNPPAPEEPMMPVPEDEPLPTLPPLEPGCGCVAAGTSTHHDNAPLALLGAALALGLATRKKRR